MTFTESYVDKLVGTLRSLDLSKIDRAIEWLREARDNGQTVFTCGNGGSASTASHFVCDIVKGASFQREKRFRIMALTDNLAAITAYSNDVGYECVFVEQLKNFAKPGDVVIAISGSGNSPNVLRAIEYANEVGCKTIGMTGRDGGQLGGLVQLNVLAADPHMGRIEDAHLIACHMLAYAFMDQPNL